MHLRRFAPTAVQFSPEQVSSLHWNHCPVLPESTQGCKWRALPKKFGNWHTIYTRMNQWAKHGV
ncbi:MAG: transposase, partial [Candidatus Thiodiazotropha sp.]